jgi:hypothetical protein
MKHCSQCVFVGETLVDPDPDMGGEGLYLCDWKVPLPVTWRYCTREVMAAEGDDAQSCPCYQPKETT